MKHFKLVLVSILLSLLTTNIYGEDKVSENQCIDKGDGYIFAGDECIQYFISEGKKESEINIVVHGTWPVESDIFRRYKEFSENLQKVTQITTVAVALTGYSGSSTNNFHSLGYNKQENLGAQKKYIEFLSDLVKKLKNKYKATKVNYIGHSAGAMMGATLTGFTPGLVNTMTSVGGRYDIHEKVKDSKDLISLVDYIDKVDSKTEFLLVYGAMDTVSEPSVTKDFYDVLNEEGLKAKLVEIDTVAHEYLDTTYITVNAIVKMLDKE
jgi:predicted esterase